MSSFYFVCFWIYRVYVFALLEYNIYVLQIRVILLQIRVYVLVYRVCRSDTPTYVLILTVIVIVKNKTCSCKEQVT